ncbi:MAG: hypothetical protein NZ561_00635, partial [Phycisphaerae bacterium]|nr:hypothetical protein [Phycisphaerae bacterium]
WGAYFGIVAGCFAGGVYYVFLSENSRWAYSRFWGLFPPVAACCGLIVWAMLLVAVTRLLLRKPASGSIAPEAPDASHVV